MLKWLNKYEILSPDDEHDLERSAAVNEFHKGLSRDESEQVAYNNYRQQQFLKAAAFHLDGMDVAKSNGKTEEQNRHYLMYMQLCKAVGIDGSSAVSPAIQAFRGTQDLSKFDHPADSWVFAK